MAEQIHLRDYLAVIRKHDFIIIASLLLVFGSALIVSLYMPRVYEASAVIEVQSSTTPSGLSNLMQNVMSAGVDRVSMETMCRRFISRSLLAEAIGNLEKRVPEMRNLLGTPESLAPKIRTKIIPDTRMVELTVRMRRDEGGSQCAARVTNELVSVMQSYRSAKTDSEMERRRRFINDEIKAVKAQIDSSDQSIRSFLKDSGDTLVWSAHAEYIMTRLSNMIGTKERIETLRTAELKRLDELKMKLAQEPEWIESSRTLSRDPMWDRYRMNLEGLERRLEAERTEFGENHPSVRALKIQISKVREDMKTIAQETMTQSARTESRNPARQTLLDQIIESELNLMGYEAQYKVVGETLEKLNMEKEQIFAEMPEKQFQLDKMKREAEYKVDAYKGLLEKELEAKIWASENFNAGMVKGGIEIVDMALPGGRPVSPRVKFIGAIAGLAGLAAGLVMAFLLEYFGDTYRSSEDPKSLIQDASNLI